MLYYVTSAIQCIHRENNEISGRRKSNSEYDEPSVGGTTITDLRHTLLYSLQHMNV